MLQLIWLAVATFMPLAHSTDCGPDQMEIYRRVDDFFGKTNTPTQPSPTSIPITSSSPSSTTPTTTTASTRPTRVSPDYRNTGSYYYDQQTNNKTPLSPREQQLANNYQQSVVEARKTSVSFNDNNFTPTQKLEIAAQLDRIGVRYDPQTYTIAAKATTAQNARTIDTEDRVRKIIKDAVSRPIEDIAHKVDLLRDQLNSVEGMVVNNMNSKSGEKLRNQPSSTDGGDYGAGRNARHIASIPNAIPPERAANDPFDLDEVINKALYVRDKTHWTKDKFISSKQSSDPLTKKLFSKEVFKSIDPQGEIRVLELINAKEEVTGIKVFVYRKDKRAWIPVFYKLDPETQEFKREAVYNHQKLPFACLNCHGSSLRKLSPEVSLGAWPTKQ